METLDHLSSHFNGGKMVRFGLCACVWGGERGYFSSYSVQDCSLSRKASPLVVGVGEPLLNTLGGRVIVAMFRKADQSDSFLFFFFSPVVFRKRNTVDYFNVLYTCFTVNFTTYTLRERRVNFHA